MTAVLTVESLGQKPLADLLHPSLAAWMPPPEIHTNPEPLPIKMRLLNWINEPWEPATHYQPHRTSTLDFGNSAHPLRKYFSPGSPEAAGRLERLHAISQDSSLLRLPGNDSVIYQHKVPFPNLHPDLRGVNILHLTDIHLLKNSLESVLALAKIADALESGRIKADICVISGDLITKSPDDILHDLERTGLRHLKRIADACPYRFAVPGNHDYHGHGKQLVMDQLHHLGFVDISAKSRSDQGRILKFGLAKFAIYGIADYCFGETYVPRDICRADFSLCLTHNLDVIRANLPRTDFILAGHTHWMETIKPLAFIGRVCMGWGEYCDNTNDLLRGFDLLTEQTVAYIGRGLATYYARGKLGKMIRATPGAALHTLVGMPSKETTTRFSVLV